MFKKIIRELSAIGGVKAVILYGGFARNDYSSKSDIDLFIVTKENKSTKEIEKKVVDLERSIGRTIQPTIRTVAELKKTDTGLLQNVFREGKMLCLKEPLDFPSAILLQQKPAVIYSFRLSSLSQKEKSWFNRNLYGAKKKGYSYEGLLQKINGQKLSPGCVIVPFGGKEILEKFFKKHNIKYEQLKVWK